MRYFLNNWLFAGEGKAALEALEKVEAREDQAWINHHKTGKPKYLPILIPFSVKVYCLQVY